MYANVVMIVVSAKVAFGVLIVVIYVENVKHFSYKYEG
jgi:hypothetical protein